MDSRLFGKAVSKFLAGLLIVGLLLFIPAGTIAYWQAWLLIIILFVPMFIAGLILMKKNPDLLRKRLNVKEEQTEQKEVIVLSGLMFLAAFILAGLNYRFDWFVLPAAGSIAAAVVLVLLIAFEAGFLLMKSGASAKATACRPTTFPPSSRTAAGSCGSPPPTASPA